MTDQFVRGAVWMGCMVIALFFLRFWRQTKDGLFALFALSFLAEAGNRLALQLVSRPHSSELLLTVAAFRFLSYALIVAAIAVKNMNRRP